MRQKTKQALQIEATASIVDSQVRKLNNLNHSSLVVCKTAKNPRILFKQKVAKDLKAYTRVHFLQSQATLGVVLDDSVHQYVNSLLFSRMQCDCSSSWTFEK